MLSVELDDPPPVRRDVAPGRDDEDDRAQRRADLDELEASGPVSSCVAFVVMIHIWLWRSSATTVPAAGDDSPPDTLGVSTNRRPDDSSGDGMPARSACTGTPSSAGSGTSAKARNRSASTATHVTLRRVIGDVGRELGVSANRTSVANRRRADGIGAQDGGPQEGVQQRRLAGLELAHDRHADLPRRHRDDLVANGRARSGSPRRSRCFDA